MNKLIVNDELNKDECLLIPIDLINDELVSLPAKRLLLSMLTDKHRVKITPELYCERLNMKEKTFYKYINELEQAAYLSIKKDENDNHIFYTIFPSTSDNRNARFAFEFIHPKNNKKQIHKMKNRKIIPYKNQLKDGECTMIPNSIMHNKNLKPNSKLLLLSILSDGDKDTYISRPIYCDRLGINDMTLNNCMKELEDNGFIKKSKIDDSHYNFYTVCVLGNLNKENNEK